MHTSTDPLIGSVLDGRYHISTKIARGGMATVYLATDERLDREVAVKVMHPHRAEDAQFVARFIREAKSAARISHPAVVAVYDQGQDAGTVYLVMEYVRGLTLREALESQQAFTPGQALDVLIPVLDALAAAHRAGLVHRDVKPENVLLAEDAGTYSATHAATVKVADFGLARAASTASSTDTLIGTAAYLSPELVSRGVADARTDVYACGIMLFELLTGRPPFSGELPAHIAYQHVNGQVPPPSSLDAGLPAALDELVALATAPDPDARPRDAAEFAQHVRAASRRLSEAELDRAPVLAPGAAASSVHHTKVVGGAADIPLVDQDVAAAGRSGASRHELRPAVTFPAVRQTQETLKPPRRRRRWSAILLTWLLVAVALTGAGGWYVTAGPGAYTVAPEIIGTQAEATEQVEAAGFTAQVTAKYHETIAKGTLIESLPAAGERIRKNAAIELVVSKGSAYTTVPVLAGQTLQQASATLQGEDLALGARSTQYSQDTAKDAVIKTDPPTGERIKRGTEVAVVLSKGKEPLDVPDQVGETLDKARAKLTDTGFTVQVTEEFSESVGKGKVISQDPRSGRSFRGDPISLVVSKGPPLVEVPNVVGKQVAEARSELKEAGFKVKVDEVLGAFFGTVRSQKPASGQAPKGSTITLAVV